MVIYVRALLVWEIIVFIATWMLVYNAYYLLMNSEITISVNLILGSKRLNVCQIAMIILTASECSLKKLSNTMLNMDTNKTPQPSKTWLGRSSTPLCNTIVRNSLCISFQLCKTKKLLCHKLNSTEKSIKKTNLELWVKFIRNIFSPTLLVSIDCSRV